MKLIRHRLFVSLLIGVIMIAWVTAISYMRHDSSSSVVPLFVSLTKHQYAKNEPIAVNVLFFNPLHRQISIRLSSFGLAENRGDRGLYIDDGQLRYQCRGHFVSDIGLTCGLELLKLNPMDSARGTITIPAEAAFPSGSHVIPYELRIPFHGNDEQFTLAPGETIVVDLDRLDRHPRDRPISDRWRDRFHDFINGNGVFIVTGKLEFVVK